MSVARIPVDIQHQISVRAVQIARQWMQRKGWKSGSHLKPTSVPGAIGIETDLKYLEYQDKGTRPYIMWSLEGKAQPLTSKVLTPSGWKLMGDIVSGTEVIDPSTGGSAKVIKVFPQGKMKVFEIHLNDGSIIEATGNHLWLVDIPTMRKKRYLWTTDQIADKLGKTSGNLSKRAIRLPNTLAVRFAKQIDPLPIPPYTLGAILGDGAIKYNRCSISGIDKDLFEIIRNELPASMEMNHDGQCSYRLVKRKGTGKTNPYISSLRDLGLLGHDCYDKFIPETYMRASVESRIELLRGLMDTDGHCDKTGRLEFVTVSERLAEDLRELILSLGGRCSIRIKALLSVSGAKIYRLQNINIPINPFNLPRKAIRYDERSYSRHSGISKIIEVGEKEVQCILVDSDSHLYITDGYAVTHNTIPIGDRIVTARGVGQPGWVFIPGRGRVYRQQKWRHPGLKAQNFMEISIRQSMYEHGKAIRNVLFKEMGLPPRGELL